MNNGRKKYENCEDEGRSKECKTLRKNYFKTTAKKRRPFKRN
jgi:hypothetical protein